MENVVQQIRIKYSITQEELAHILGVSYSSVNAWEGGKRVPQEQMLHLLTDILNADALPNVDSSSNRAKGLFRSGAGYVSSVVDYDNIRDPFPYTHGIGRWYGSLPSFLVRDFLQFARTDLNAAGPVLANFSGSGTVPLEAGLSSAESFATDINPMALLLSRLKTSRFGVSDSELLSAHRRIISHHGTLDRSDPGSSSNLLVTDNKWLSGCTRADLADLCSGISAETDFYVQLIFSVALATVAVDFANVDKRCTNHYVYKENPNYSRSALETRLLEESAKYLELSRTLADAPNYVVPTICYGDACSLPFESSTMGLVFSHPPYGTTINYYSINRIPISIIEEISFRNSLNLPAGDLCKKKDLSSGTLPRFQSFTRDWISEVSRVLKPGGILITVVGDSRDGGKLSHPFTDIIAAGEANGLILKELFIWVTNHKAGMHVKRKGNHIDHNYIIMMEKSV